MACQCHVLESHIFCYSKSNCYLHWSTQSLHPGCKKRIVFLGFHNLSFFRKLYFCRSFWRPSPTPGMPHFLLIINSHIASAQSKFLLSVHSYIPGPADYMFLWECLYFFICYSCWFCVLPEKTEWGRIPDYHGQVLPRSADVSFCICLF